MRQHIRGGCEAVHVGAGPQENLRAWPVAVVGKYGKGTSAQLAAHVGITPEEILSHERYKIMGVCLEGGVCVCDEYLAASLTGLTAKEMPWVAPTEILIAHQLNPSVQVRHFIETARRTTARPGAQAH